MVLPTPPPTPPPPPAPISPLTQADVDALVAGALAHPPQELPAWLPLGVAAFIRATIAASAASEEDLRARAVAQMEAESAHLPNGSPVAAPDYFRRDRAHPGRPAAWIRDWDSGALRPRRLLDDLWEAPVSSMRFFCFSLFQSFPSNVCQRF